MLNSRPVLTAALMIAMLVGALVYHLRLDAIFACDGSQYGSNRYMAYCNAVSYANYDQGAFWFEIEEPAYANAVAADVLFIGNSKQQFGLSTDVTERWFRDRNLSYFLFGFAHNETLEFFAPMIERMQPRARAIVIHVDRMFESRLTPPMQVIRTDQGAERVFRTKRLWQPLHQLVCESMPNLCGRKFGLHRDGTNGHWLFSGTEGILDDPIPVSVGPPVEAEQWPRRGDRAARFVAGLPIDRPCVFLTLTPSKDARLAEAHAIAARVGLPLISPNVDSLNTFDNNHLDEPSALRWSGALLDALATAGLDECVSTQGVE